MGDDTADSGSATDAESNRPLHREPDETELEPVEDDAPIMTAQLEETKAWGEKTIAQIGRGHFEQNEREFIVRTLTALRNTLDKGRRKRQLPPPPGESLVGRNWSFRTQPMLELIHCHGHPLPYSGSLSTEPRSSWRTVHPLSNRLMAFRFCSSVSVTHLFFPRGRRRDFDATVQDF